VAAHSDTVVQRTRICWHIGGQVQAHQRERVQNEMVSEHFMAVARGLPLVRLLDLIKHLRPPRPITWPILGRSDVYDSVCVSRLLLNHHLLSIVGIVLRREEMKPKRITGSQGGTNINDTTSRCVYRFRQRNESWCDMGHKCSHETADRTMKNIRSPNVKKTGSVLCNKCFKKWICYWFIHLLARKIKKTVGRTTKIRGWN
jgi:hypothetical protein